MPGKASRMLKLMLATTVALSAAGWTPYSSSQKDFAGSFQKFALQVSSNLVLPSGKVDCCWPVLATSLVTCCGMSLSCCSQHYFWPSETVVL